MTQEALKLALDFVETVHLGEWVGSIERQLEVITAIKEVLAQPEQEPVAIVHRNEYNEYRLEPHDNFDIKSIPFNVDVPLFKSPQPKEPEPEQEPVALETLLKWDDDIDPIGEVVGFIEDSNYIMVKVHKGKQVSLNDDLYATPPQRNEQCNYPDCKCPTENPCLKKLAQPVQEPVIGKWSLREVYFDEDGEPISHRSPPQRTWVGLTDDEIAHGWKESWVTEQAWQSAVWWAEAKLKEKNT